MRRLVAVFAAVVLIASLAASAVAAGPTYRVNRMVGNFDILDWDGSLVGHIVVDYTEPSAQKWVPGSLDVNWVPGARFPYQQPPYGAKQSHTVLTGGSFGEDPIGVIGTSATGSMCDFGWAWNATCHDFAVVIQVNPGGDGRNLIGFSTPSWETTEFYVVGPGAFALTYVGPTGS